MRKITLMFMFVFVCVLCVVSVEGALTSNAKIAGYHSILYTDSIDVADDSLDAIAILPNTFIVGTGLKSLWVQGDASGNYIFNTLTGNYVSFPDNVSVGGSLRMAGYGPVIDNTGRWIGQPIDSSQVTINTTNNLFARSGSCPANQVMVGIDSNGATCVVAPRISCAAGQLLTWSAGSSSWVCSSLPNILPSCGAGQYLFWDGSNWVCRAVSANTVLPSCANGQSVMWNGANWVCLTTASVPSCAAGQLLMWNGGAWVCSSLPSVLPSCAANQYLFWNGGAWVCSTVTANTVLPSCGANQYLFWDGAAWVCQVPAAGANYWTQSGNDIFSAVTGNVGIGTNPPAEKLDVSGNIKSSGSVTSASVSTGTLSSTGATNLATISGNVGVGTASPTKKLEVNQNQNAISEVLLQNSNAGSSAQALVHTKSDVVDMYTGTTSSTFPTTGGVGTAGYVNVWSSHPLVLLTGNTPRITISSNGNVGIGTTAPARKLDINDSTNARDNTPLRISGPMSFDPNGQPSQWGSVKLAFGAAGETADAGYIKVRANSWYTPGVWMDFGVRESTSGSGTFREPLKLRGDQVQITGTLAFTGGTGPFCIFSTACPTGWIDHGLGGFILQNGATCPYITGGNFNAGYYWCQPRICCNS